MRSSCVVLSCFMIFQASLGVPTEAPRGENFQENFDEPDEYSIEYLGGISDYCAEDYFGEYSDGYLDGYLDGWAGNRSYGIDSDSFDKDSGRSGQQSGSSNDRPSERIRGSASYPNKFNLEGFYVGLGVTYDRIRSRIYMDDNLSQLAWFKHAPNEYEKSEGYYYEPDSHGLPCLSANKSRFGGNITVGYGGFFSGNSWFTDNCYMGIEISADVAGGGNVESEHIVVEHGNNPDGKIVFGKCSVKYEDIVPSAAVRFGGYVHWLESLVFLRAGCKYLRYKMDFEFFPDQNVRGSFFVPLVGLGIEKNIAHGFALKAEIDYNFDSTKKHDVSLGNFRNGPDKSYKAGLKHQVRGYTARLSGVYHF